jgi:hypothetical protein
VSIPRLQEVAALALALCSLLLGLSAIAPLPLYSFSLLPKELWSAILLVIGGSALVMGLGQQLPPILASGGVVAIVSPLRRVTVPIGGILERVDGVLRRWPLASLSVAVLVIMFVWLML